MHEYKLMISSCYHTYMVSNDWQEGGCFCGDVRYRVRGEAVWKSGCTCNTCVKMHGAPYVVWAGFDRSNYEVKQGDPTVFHSSKHAIRKFCPRCGTTLNYGKDARGVMELERAAQLVYIAVATLDDPTTYPPDEVVHAQERIPWLHLGNEIPLRKFISPETGHLQLGGATKIWRMNWRNGISVIFQKIPRGWQLLLIVWKDLQV